MEWKLFTGKPDFVSAEWYEEREAAHHLEQEGHRDRLIAASQFVLEAIKLGGKEVVDLGCGDGGMLSLLKDSNVKCWGYDLSPSNVEYAVNVRKVDARYTDFHSGDIKYADIAVLTEVLEHMEDPHEVVRSLPSKYLIASSPYHETDLNHYEFHLWAWDEDGYRALLEQGGYKIINSQLMSGAHILLGVRE
jgi:SAM-dependent methyltransferase